MSVVIRSVLEADGRTARHVALSMAVAEVDVATCFALGLAIERDPQPGEPAHAHVVGTKTKSVRRKLALASRWAVSPPGERQ
jgi:hypothetical protein